MSIERHKTILDILGSRGFCSADEIAQHIDISPVTIRRDFTVLEQQGMIRRVHGGATLPESIPLAKPLSWRFGENKESKERIGAYIASLVKPGSTLMLDAGSTCACVARALAPLCAVRVITHSLTNIHILTEKKSVEIIAVGGVYIRELGSFTGPAAESTLAQYHADLSVLAAAHLNVEQGLVNNHTAEWTIKRTIHSHATRCILAVDSSKFGVRGFQSTVPIDELRCEILTDTGLPDEQRRAFEERGLKVTIV